MTCVTTPALIGLIIIAAMVGATIGMTALALVCVGRNGR